MKRTSLLLLTIFGLLLAVYVSGCATLGDSQDPLSGLSVPSSSVSLGNFVERSDTKILLDVPFLPQVAPGNWSNTRNCGQTSAVMIRAYYQGTEPTSSDIIAADQWLAANYGISLNGGNSDWTNCFQIRGWLESENVPVKVGMGNLDRLRSFLREGKPVLVAVYSGMNPNGGAKHAMVAVGIDATSVYVNDPGKVNGANNTYSIAQFVSAWQAQGNWYVALE
ncbi:MAG: papain-like cysteine protease family protein [Atribacterota bacterium]